MCIMKSGKDYIQVIKLGGHKCKWSLVCIDEDGTEIIIWFNDAYNLFKCNSFNSNTVTLGLL